MRNFFYAPLIALMLLFVSCGDSDGIDDGTGDLDSDVVPASFAVHPQDVSFDTNLQRWDSKTVTFSVDPGSNRITTDSFSWKADPNINYGDYFTVKISSVPDVENEFQITFRSLAGAEALVDSLEVPMSLVMTFNGFDQASAEPFNVILPADQYSSYFIEQPADAIFKAGFVAGSICESRFTIDPQDAGNVSFVVEESDNFAVDFFEGDEENEFVAQFTAKEAFRTAADAALAAYGVGTPNYDYNNSVSETVAITVVAENPEVDDQEVLSEEFTIVAELANVDPTIISVSDITFESNFEVTDIFIGTIEIDPGTKNISRTSFSMVENDNYSIVSFASAAVANTYSVYLNPTELSVGASEDPAFEEDATISMVYEDYGDTITLVSDTFKVIFEEDKPELPSFTTTPTGVLFATGSSTTTTMSATFIINDGTFEITADSLSCTANDYYTATFEATGSKDEYMVTFMLKDAAFALAPGSESALIDAAINVTCQGGIVKSPTFKIEVEGRLNFDHYIYNLTHNAAICHVDGFDATVVASSEILSKGILYTTDQSADISDWIIQQVESSSTSYGGISSYECVIAGLEPSTTYYVMPYVTQTDGYSYGEVTAFTTYANAAAVSQPGRCSWAWNTAPVDEMLKDEIEANINEAVDYYNIYTNNNFSMKISYDGSVSSSYILTNVLYLASGDYSVGRIMNLMMTFAGVGESVWTTSMISGNYYNKSRANAFYQLITNQYGGSAKMAASSTGIYVYDLVTGSTGAATLKPADATPASLVKLAVIMGLAYDDGLAGYDIPSAYVLIDGINVALNKKATASSTAIGYDPSYAIDGDKYSTVSRWLSSYSTPTWIQIDLEGEYTITGFNFYGGENVSSAGYNAGIMAYQFQYLNKYTNSWTDIISVDSQERSLGCFSQTFPTPVTCSVVRLYVTQSNEYNQMRVYELEVMSDFIR